MEEGRRGGEIAGKAAVELWLRKNLFALWFIWFRYVECFCD